MASFSQVASSIASLTARSRSFKYLEAFCNANGIDVADLKTEGPTIKKAELFFAGLPVLIGMKYFDRLSTLQIVGHELTSLKPLSEASGTLEELWICEGPLKDLSGIESCTRLKRLFIYDNQIESASSLSSLTALSTLHASNNRINDINFLVHLPYLISLNLSHNSLSDSSLLECSQWPKKLHHIDMSENRIVLFMSFFPLAICSSLRSLSFFPSSTLSASITKREDYFAWAAHHFHFLENIDGDGVTEEFVKRHMASNRLCDAWIEYLTEDQRLRDTLVLIDKHSTKISNKLRLLITALEKQRDLLSAKDSRREIVRHALESTSTKQKNVSMHRKSWREHTRLLRDLNKLSIATKLEGASTELFRSPDDNTRKLLEHWINYNCSSKHVYEYKLRLCLTRRPLGKDDLDRLFYIDCDQIQRSFNDRSIIHIIQRRLVTSFRKPPLRLWKDFEMIQKELDEKKRIVNVVMVCTRAVASAVRKSEEKLIVTTDSDASDNGMIPSSTDHSNLQWIDVSVVAVATIEICSKNELTMEDLQDTTDFDKKFSDQIDRLKEINIKVDLKDEPAGKHLNRERSSDREDSMNVLIDNEILQGTVNSVSKSFRSVRDVLSPPLLSTRWLASSPIDATSATVLKTIRNPIEISLCYGSHSPALDIVDFKNTVTVLDLFSMNLHKLSGIEDLQLLTCLSLKNNRLTTIGNLSKLHNLFCLDISDNRIVKIDDLPEMLSHLIMDGNRIASLQFCTKLQLLVHLSANRNHLKSTKGLEKCKQLEMLLLSTNMIGGIDDVTSSINGLSLLTFLDLRGNAVEHADGYRIHIIDALPSLECLDLLKLSHIKFNPYIKRIKNLFFFQVANGARSSAGSKTIGRALTLDLISKSHPNLATSDTIICSGMNLEIVSLEPTDITKLSHINHVDLSNNNLRQLGEVAEMTEIKTLDVTSNKMISLFPETSDEVSSYPLSNLNRLNISCNDLTTSSLLSLQLPRLSALTSLNLSKNHITKLDLPLFAAIPCLEQLDVSFNEIKTMHKASLTKLKELNLANNRLKDLSALNGAVALQILDVSNNRLTSLAALKSISAMSELKSIDCTGNSVTERRVYSGYMRNQIRSLEILDRAILSSLSEQETHLNPRRRSTSVNPNEKQWDLNRNGGIDVSMFTWGSVTPLDIQTSSFNQRWNKKINL